MKIKMEPWYYLIPGGVAVAIAAVLWKRRTGGGGGALPLVHTALGDIDLGPIDTSRAAIHKAARPIVEVAVQRVLGRPGTPAELQYVQAVSYLETNYGKGWNGAMVGSNNWGAVQCPGNAQSGPDCIPYQDSQSSGAKYNVSFRRYATPEDGATDVAKRILKSQPLTASALSSPEGTVSMASYAMRREHYYGGFCPKALAQFGAAAADASFAHPDRDEGTSACAKEAVILHITVAGKLVKAIAAAVGEEPMRIGNFDDADDWYKSTRGAVA